ncbi:hypothetical protein [Paraflavitalea speifideaquila]|uniref:hypothetical protein n=1 Tax=Paraflavitalea speifideaquila TaxID=3076558 RepID=UPI0028E6B290|nr:hypothetical protein [Paraflavitalea speifideiaquila]
MDIQATKTDLQHIAGLRTLFLQEYPVQFVHNKCHLYGWADTYLFTADGQPAGYGSVWGSNKREDRDAMFEFYLLVPYRKMAAAFFAALRQASGIPFIECQTNHPQLQALVFEHARNIHAEAILFEDQYQTSFSLDDTHFEKE